MARDYGRVRTLFWESETVCALSPEVKFVGLYLLTSPHTNAIGCFRLPAAYVAHDTGMTETALQAAFKALREAGFMQWCERTPWIYLPKYLKHNPPENPNVWRRCVSEMKLLPVELSARAVIAVELFQIAAEERMRTLSGDEKNRLEPFGNRTETVSKGIPPCPVPSPSPDPGPLPNQVKKEVVAPVALPAWMPLDPWNSFLQTRKKITPRAVDLLIRELSKLKEGGDDPKEVLERSIMNGWKGLFPLKRVNEHGSGLRKPTATDQHLAGIASLVEDIRERRNARQG